MRIQVSLKKWAFKRAKTIDLRHSDGRALYNNFVYIGPIYVHYYTLGRWD